MIALHFQKGTAKATVTVVNKTQSSNQTMCPVLSHISPEAWYILKEKNLVWLEMSTFGTHKTSVLSEKKLNRVEICCVGMSMYVCICHISETKEAFDYQ